MSASCLVCGRSRLFRRIIGDGTGINYAGVLYSSNQSFPERIRCEDGKGFPGDPATDYLCGKCAKSLHQRMKPVCVQHGELQFAPWGCAKCRREKKLDHVKALSDEWEQYLAHSSSKCAICDKETRDGKPIEFWWKATFSQGGVYSAGPGTVQDVALHSTSQARRCMAVLCHECAARHRDNAGSALRAFFGRATKYLCTTRPTCSTIEQMAWRVQFDQHKQYGHWRVECWDINAFDKPEHIENNPNHAKLFNDVKLVDIAHIEQAAFSSLK